MSLTGKFLRLRRLSGVAIVGVWLQHYYSLLILFLRGWRSTYANLYLFSKCRDMGVDKKKKKKEETAHRGSSLSGDIAHTPVHTGSAEEQFSLKKTWFLFNFATVFCPHLTRLLRLIFGKISFLFFPTPTTRHFPARVSPAPALFGRRQEREFWTVHTSPDPPLSLLQLLHSLCFLFFCGLIGDFSLFRLPQFLLVY